MVRSDGKICEIITLELEWFNAMMNDIQFMSSHSKLIRCKGFKRKNEQHKVRRKH
jgi:hypothetical protein